MRKTDECNGCVNGKGDNCTVDVDTFAMRMAESGTCYQVSKKVEISARLARLAVEMDDIAIEMEYYGGLSHWAARAKEMHGAAKMAVDWSEGILEEEGNESNGRKPKQNGKLGKHSQGRNVLRQAETGKPERV